MQHKKAELANTTALNSGDFNSRLLEALIGANDKVREELAANVIKAGPNGDARWEEIRKKRAALSMAELQRILEEMEKQNLKAKAIADQRLRSPFTEQAFYEALAKNATDGDKLKKQLKDLHEAAQKEKGFLAARFSLFTAKDPVEKAMKDVASFEKYCHKNGIKYDAIHQQLVQGEKPRSGMDKLWEMRFLIAAVGGAALGFAGLNLGLLPVLAAAPAVFFGALPWLAAPFIGLNIYRSFSQYSIMKEAPTLGRFAAITAAGLAISLGVVLGMGMLIPPVDPATIGAAASVNMGGGGFSPMQYMLPIIGAFTGAALIYKRAKATVAGEFNKEADPATAPTKLQKAFRMAQKVGGKVADVFINKTTAPYLVKAGNAAEKATDVINKYFPKFIDVAGLPAVAVLMSATMATGGLGLLGAFAGYYATAFAGMAVGGAALMAGYYKMGCRGKDFKELGSAAVTGFSLSSSSATMPKERECLKAIGVSKKTRDTVVPLGGVFNMFGTSLYMGLTAFYAVTMFAVNPNPMQYMQTAAAVMAIALGAPGIPASNITLLDPVMRQTGMAADQIGKVYSMIIPADRILDMTQTALNVLGDMVAAVHPDRKRLRYVRAKNIKRIRQERLKKEGFKPVPVPETAATPAPAAQQPPVNDNPTPQPVVKKPAVGGPKP